MAMPSHIPGTPKKVGSWLAGARLEDTVPLEDLQGLFPRAGRFEFQEVALTEADLRVQPGQVWIYDEKSADPAKRLRQVSVRVGLTDGQFTELVAGEALAAEPA